MAVEERDPHTGYLTTGHEWNGIKELNTPVPRAVYVFLVAAALFAIGYWILMPAWPLGVSYTKGLLGIDQRKIVVQSLQQAAIDRAVWTKRVETESFDAIRADPNLMKIVRETGRTLFGDNCAACHGTGARGSKGFPDLTTPSRLWGGTAEQIFGTIRVGVNSAHPDSRASQMPAFGRDQILQRNDIENVAAFVRSLSVPDAGKRPADAAAIKAGEKIFAANCASCHGEKGSGNTDVGAPDLTDRSWIYGGDLETIYTTVWGGPAGTHADLGPAPNRARSQNTDALCARLAERKSMKPAVGQLRLRVLAWLFVATGLLVLVGANWHLVHVATVSQPDCVPHLRQGQSDRGEYRAAVSSCSLK